MMTIRWSWIFILYSLLVRLGSAALPDDDHSVDEIHWRTGFQQSNRILDFLNLDSSMDPPKKSNAGAIVGGSIGGLTVLCIFALLFLKRRRRITDVEEGPNSPTAMKKERSDSCFLDPKPQFSPDDKKREKTSRLRDALSRRPGICNKAPLDNILHRYNVVLPAGSTESIDRPPPTLSTHVPHHPCTLQRGSKKRPSPPPLLDCHPDFSPVSMADSAESIDSVGREMIDRQQLRMPPTALIVPTPGRTLPNTVVASAQSAGLHKRKSPSRRRSVFSKDPSKHPFIPVQGIDTTLRFPGSPLHAQYQPSRQHLEARMEARSPRIEGSLRSARLGKDSASIGHQFHPPGSSRQGRLVEALQSAGKIPRTPRTPVPNGSLTALPPHSDKHSLHSAKFLPGPPTASYM
ncbi:hypothetical protein C0993_010031 [Termitomyces sp. T159_Od127]|nr:hypothetical protein C0993_010031 [Termitomyces sp. T159_Od127]